jgi:hypothetical protein
MQRPSVATKHSHTKPRSTGVAWGIEILASIADMTMAAAPATPIQAIADCRFDSPKLPQPNTTKSTVKK